MAAKVYDLKFSANLSTLYDDLLMTDRFRRAESMGFSAVEGQFLYDFPLEDLKMAKEAYGVDIVMFNSPIGDPSLAAFFNSSDEDDFFGIACIPGLECEWLKLVQESIRYAVPLYTKKIHFIAGLTSKKHREEDFYHTYINNIRSAAEILEEYNMTVLIEPISTQAKPKYFMNSFNKAKKVIDDIGMSNVRILMDIYHMQMMNLDLEHCIKEYLPITGHIQISQAPLRNEPFADGPIDYNKIFQVLEDEKYDGYIGLEYTPSDPATGFNWLKDYGIVPSE